jgi:uncharacterized damage-inducible protein DinB
MPVAHALEQASEDLERAAASLDATLLWARPAGAASVGFHLRHVAGVIDRLFTYARGDALGPAQLRELAGEAEPGDPAADAASLLRRVGDAVEAALEQLRRTAADTLLEPRGVGRRQLPSNVLGLLCHAAEHAQRHTGQAIVTAKVVREQSG